MTAAIALFLLAKSQAQVSVRGRIVNSNYTHRRTVTYLLLAYLRTHHNINNKYCHSYSQATRAAIRYSHTLSNND